MGTRWDAVVENSDFWTERARSVSEAPHVDEVRPTYVQVWLFGSLNKNLVKNPVSVGLQKPFSVADVIAELGRTCGRTFLEQVSDPAGKLVRNCRVFVNGEAVNDTSMTVQVQTTQNRIELIMLTAAEGG